MSSRDDDAWRQIVEHYGDAPEFPDEPADEPGPGADSEPGVPEAEPFADPADEVPELERFVPPDPPPLPRPRGARLFAWLGIFGSPVLLLVSLFLNLRLPSTISTLVVMWFLGGFLYLVYQMPKQRDDPWDDGARL
ncbi:hypothetical protein [Nocardioides sp.]|uniref:hypothetical protein n=1 Tax=Nocardioides sp. TaxID=35761 RepID=UPI003D0BDC88